MGAQILYSTELSVHKAVADIKNQSSGLSPKGLIYFGSCFYDAAELSEQLHRSFEGTACVGCSSMGEIIPNRMMKNSLVVLLLEDDVLEDIYVELVPDVRTKNHFTSAFNRIDAHFAESSTELDVNRHVGIVLIDGTVACEEKVMDHIGDLTDITVVGGSASDDFAFQEAFVSANGKCSSNAAVIAILQLKNGFDIIKTQSVRSLEHTLTVTEAVEEERRVISFDGKPAAQAYAELLGCRVDSAPDYFMTNPLGLMIEGEPFVRSPGALDGTDMMFACAIQEGVTLELLASGDIVADTRAAVHSTLNKLGSVNAVLDFHCGLRMLELRHKNQCEAYANIFDGLRMMGFCTYGEQLLGHMNQTSTMLVIR